MFSLIKKWCSHDCIRWLSQSLERWILQAGQVSSQHELHRIEELHVSNVGKVSKPPASSTSTPQGSNRSNTSPSSSSRQAKKLEIACEERVRRSYSYPCVFYSYSLHLSPGQTSLIDYTIPQKVLKISDIYLVERFGEQCTRPTHMWLDATVLLREIRFLDSRFPVNGQETRAKQQRRFFPSLLLSPLCWSVKNF